MIGAGIRELCALSLLCGAAMLVAPDGSVKKMCKLCCTAVLILSILGSFKSLDLKAYGENLGKFNSLNMELFQRSEEALDSMNRFVIAEKCEEYILDKAKELDLEIQELELELDWSREGYWYPSGVTISAKGDSAAMTELQEIIACDLGISEDRQKWT